MNKYTEYSQKIIFIGIASFAFFGTIILVSHAGSLVAPSGTPVATSYTLDDIYNRLSTNVSADVTDHYLSTTTSPAATFHTLSEIYDAIPTIDATKVVSGTSYLGVDGTATKNTAVKKTGQTLCYDATGNTEDTVSCAGTGQDGQYQRGTDVSFVNNGNGTITDVFTGLMWVRDPSQIDDGQGTWGTPGNPIRMTFEEAIENCDSLVYGGYSDWRLPTTLEILSIVDYSRLSPAVYTTYFANIKFDDYWTSTTIELEPTYIWTILTSGGVSDGSSKADGHRTICVRP